MEINGISHVYLTSGRFELARAFYRKLLPFLGMTEIADREDRYYCVGGRTGLGIVPSVDHPNERFDQQRVGLHHLCFRARERAHVDELHAFLQELGTPTLRSPQEDHWASGYYSILFEDPDGVRLEFNYVPGRGVLESLSGG